MTVTQGRGFTLSAPPQSTVEGALHGVLEPEGLQALEALLPRAEAAGGPRRLLLRTEAVTAAGPEALARWEALHRRLAQGGWRTAYVDGRPWGRGLALRAMHAGGDPQGLAVPSERQARAWLAAQGTRVGAARAALGAGR
ncbi:hypothetical protein FGE12_23400 [Aggregicoccus sp. 17bor-14]|uniref:hypothetical protein n=1 Tax=Myxococcaceae TaxID=31 RepID=UPI00129CC479|nr:MULTISPECIES: hypothetical protein [Myxococcaceae]MBF5045371.1 hypothetical protein [Simulacricoccus sp. 17bor-14]MRI91113.1 hypothetical protein [Aggregicoccus sp. 17bor-14]